MISFASPFTAAWAAAIAVLALLGTWWRSRLPVKARVLMTLAIALFATAAGEPDWDRAAPGRVLVLVDLSPSTRGATYRHRQALLSRIRSLIGDLPFDITAFSDHLQPLPAGEELPDLPCDRTTFTVPPADSVLLFSDGQFDPPTTLSSPVYPVMDPALDDPADNRVDRLEITNQLAVADVQLATASGTTPRIAWINAVPITRAGDNGAVTQYARPTTAGPVAVKAEGVDLWPENNEISIIPPPPDQLQLWWIGPDVPPGWTALTADQLPTDPLSFLPVGCVVLHEVASEDLSSAQQLALSGYVADLSGAVVIAGANRSFDPKLNPAQSPLEKLSPLSCYPPGPGCRWVLLLDGSGSMGTATADTGDATPWQLETSAVTSLLPLLPPDDPVDLGSFSKAVQWWTNRQAAGQLLNRPWPPPGVAPTGPTNLRPALLQTVQSLDGSIDTQLLLSTDADADLPDPEALASSMNARHIHLRVLATGRGKALPALQKIADLTGGSVVIEARSAQWMPRAQGLLRSALPDHQQHQPIAVQFTSDAPMTGTIASGGWVRVWQREQSIELAHGEAASPTPLAARWRRGGGQVTALAFAADSATIAAFASQVAAPPSDPRYTVTVDNGVQLHVTVRAVDTGKFMNSRAITMRRTDLDTQATTDALLNQTGPGLYEINAAVSPHPQLLQLFDDRQRIDQRAIAGRYAPEFAAIGNNLPQLRALAERSGGALIGPTAEPPLRFSWPRRQFPLETSLCITGFLLLGVALVLSKNS